MRVVVAGAAGNLGWEVTNTLLEAGHTVVALDYNIQRLEPIRSQLAVMQQIDLRQSPGLQDLLTGTDVVITTVGISRPKKLSDFHDVDYLSNLNLLHAAQKAGVGLFVYISVAGVDTDLSVPLLKAKYDFEQALTSSGLPYLIIRPSSYFTDLWRTFMTNAQKGKITLIKTSEPYRFSPVHPKDVALFIASQLDQKNQVYAVGGPEQFTYPEIANLCFELLGTTPKISYMSVTGFDLFLGILKLLKPPLWSVMRFLRWASTTDLTCPTIGQHTAREYLIENLTSETAR